MSALPSDGPREVREVPMPPEIAALPRHKSGYPVPWFCPVVDGEPDLKLLDARKQLQAIRERRCAICGQPVGYWIAFITGPLGVQNRVVTDPGMHEACARYAVQVCPFIARPGARRAAHKHPDSEPAIGGVVERPDRVAVYVTRHYTAFSPDGRQALIRMAPAARVEWYEGGHPI